MRIVFLANADIGLYKFRKEIVEHFCKDNEVIIVLPNGEYIPQLTKLGCTFIEFNFNRRGMNPFADINQILRYYKLLKELLPDVVLTYTIKPNVYGGIACQMLKIPYISNVTGLGTSIENGGLLSFITKALYKLGLKKCNCVFFQNKSNQSLFVDHNMVKGKSVLIPGSGVNLEANSYEQYPPDKTIIKFLFVGRIMRDKGINELLESAKIVKSQYPNTQFDIIGWSDENYDQILKEYQDDGIVIYHGLQSEMHDFYKDTNCVVLPSYHEGTANVLLEASATGRPVITTRVPGCIETFDEGVTGFGCEAHSVESLVDAIIRFLSISDEDRKKMGLAARAKMEKEYDRKLVIAAYEQEIRSIARR